MKAVVFFALCSIAVTQSLHAQAQNDGANVSLAVGGYLRSLLGARDLGYDPVGSERRAGFNGEVVRIKWLVGIGDNIRIDVHNRLQTTLTSVSTTAGQSVLGFGVSAVPSRSIDLEQILIENDNVRLWHDIDRLSATGYFDFADVTVGRQAVTWGVSNIFPVADLWAQFSPFELDTEEKPGVDAIRALMYPGTGIELDLVLGDRGSRRDLSGGARVTAELPVGDVYGAVGKFWRQLMTLVGTSFVVDSWKIRGEVAVPWDLDDSEFRAPRTTIGADWISTDFQLSAEYHFNGLGAASNAGYAEKFLTPELARGETYYLGQHYVGVVGSHQTNDRLTLALSGLSNLQDPSFAISPVMNYNIGQNARIIVGGLISLGSKPQFTAFGVPQFQSEFGAYGSFGYTQFSLYF